MHFHLPKPLHGWREFLGEVGIIVVGILIALALETFADEYRWSGKVAEARQQLRYEVGDNLLLLHTRNRLTRCIDERIDELGLILNEAIKNGRLPPVGGPVGGVFFGLHPTGVWQSQVSAQTGTHLSAGQLAALSRIYRNIDLVRDGIVREKTAWDTLQAMTGPGRPVDPSTSDRIASALGTVRITNSSMAILESNIRAVLAEGTLGADFPQIDPQNRPNVEPFLRKTKICQPIPHNAPPIYGMAPPYKLTGLR